MHDPFPFSSPAFFSKLVQPVADRYNLQTLPIHIHEVVFAFLLYHTVNVVVSPWLSTRLFPRLYPNFNRRTKINWDVHVVSFVQSSLINVLALWVSYVDQERSEMDWKQRVWGYTGAGGMIQGFACGYFLWDLWISLRYVNVFGLGLLAHAVSALLVFSLGFRPFVNFYGPTFILYELSSPFLNIHWFCDKLNMTGSKLQLYNGMLLIFTFFSCRLVWGSYQSVCAFYDIFRALKHPGWPGAAPGTDSLPDDRGAIMAFAGGESIPLWLACSYLGANITLNSLNFFWFGKMIETIRKRFDPPLGTKGVDEKVAVKHEKLSEKEQILVEGIDVDTDNEVEKIGSGEEDGVAIAKGVYADGRTTVELEKTEVRQRRR